MLETLAARLVARPARPVLRVAVDGVDGAGKTTFADELTAVLRQRGRVVIRASVDGFHHPRAVRYRLGQDSPEGFYRDSYDYAGLRRALLDPLGPGGSRRYRTAMFDVNADQPVSHTDSVCNALETGTAPISTLHVRNPFFSYSLRSDYGCFSTPFNRSPYQEEMTAPPGSILLVDGLFLHRPELRGVWDDSVFLRVDFAVSVPRGAARGPGFGSPDPGAQSNWRYIGGNRLYFREVTPERRAGVVVDNNDLTAPFIVPGGHVAG